MSWWRHQIKSNQIFRVTGPLCGEFTGHQWIPTQRPVTRSFDVSFDLHLNKQLSKHSRHTGVLRRNRAHYKFTVMCPIICYVSNITGINDRPLTIINMNLYDASLFEQWYVLETMQQHDHHYRLVLQLKSNNSMKCVHMTLCLLECACDGGYIYMCVRCRNSTLQLFVLLGNPDRFQTCRNVLFAECIINFIKHIHLAYQTLTPVYCFIPFAK